MPAINLKVNHRVVQRNIDLKQEDADSLHNISARIVGAALKFRLHYSKFSVNSFPLFL